jgi:hypothetical protein
VPAQHVLSDAAPLLDRRCASVRQSAAVDILTLFADDPVGPFHQRNEYRRAAPLRAPVGQVCFRDPTGPGAGPSRKDGDVFGDNFFHHLGQRRPADGLDGIHCRLAHQVRGFSGEEDLHVVSGVGKGERVGETKEPRVGSSVPHPLLIMIFSFFDGVWAGAWASLVEAAKAPTASAPAA